MIRTERIVVVCHREIAGRITARRNSIADSRLGSIEVGMSEFRKLDDGRSNAWRSQGDIVWMHGKQAGERESLYRIAAGGERRQLTANWLAVVEHALALG